MQSSRSRLLAAILGLLGLVVSWMEPAPGGAMNVAGGEIPACCSQPSKKRCCAGECCVAKASIPAGPSTSLPVSPGESLRIVPDWVPPFLALLDDRLGLPSQPRICASPCCSSVRAALLPLFLRDAALLI